MRFQHMVTTTKLTKKSAKKGNAKKQHVPTCGSDSHFGAEVARVSKENCKQLFQFRNFNKHTRMQIVIAYKRSYAGVRVCVLSNLSMAICMLSML